MADVDGIPTNEIQFLTNPDGRQRICFFLKTLHSHEEVPRAATFSNHNVSSGGFSSNGGPSGPSGPSGMSVGGDSMLDPIEDVKVADATSVQSANAGDDAPLGNGPQKQGPQFIPDNAASSL